MSSSDEKQHSSMDLMVDEIFQRLRAGEIPRMSEYLDRYPENAGDVRSLFPILMMAEQLGVNEPKQLLEWYEKWSEEQTQRGPDGNDKTGLFVESKQTKSGDSDRDFDLRSDIELRDLKEPKRRSPMIGNYKLLQKIAEGGMGAVWMAEQQQPVVRGVALKLIKTGKDSEQIIARFEAERQALAMMEHQNIAKMLDGGQTPDGLPYFVMELVQGIPITKYCDQNRLNLDERLSLFIPVCQAVQHAHQKGIIHRDLKPSNILVTLCDGKPVPKVIDFGLAKAVQHQNRLTDKTMFTEFGQIVGTLQYMSPEQAEMNSLDVDTRTDIYSLGVLLYEILTGSTPIEKAMLEKESFIKVLEMIRTKDPPRPSTRLSGSGAALPVISEQRKLTAEKLRGILRGDLDWVVMKALEKDRTRRYETASEFAHDVVRFMNNEPLRARPPSQLYIAQKFVRKNRAAVISAAIMMALLMLGFAGTTIGWTRAIAENQRANEASKTATASATRAMKAESEEKARSEQLLLRSNELERITRFQQSQLSEIDSTKMGAELRKSIQQIYEKEIRRESSNELETRAVLDAFEIACSKINFTDLANHVLDESIFAPSISAIESKYADQPLFRAKMYSTIADSLRQIGMSSSAAECLNRAYVLQVAHLGMDHIETLETKHTQACVISDQGLIPASIDLFREVLDDCQRVLGNDHPLTSRAKGTLAGALVDAGKYSEAESLHRENLLHRQRILEAKDSRVLDAMSDLARCLKAQSKFDEAESLFTSVLERTREIHGVHHEETYAAMLNLASALQPKGNFAKSLEMESKVVAGLRELLGNEHPKTLTAINNLAGSHLTGLDYDNAERLYREVVETKNRIHGVDHPDTLMSKANLGLVTLEQGKHEESISILNDIVARSKSVLGIRHPKTIDYVGSLSDALLAAERFEEALPWVREYYREVRTLESGIALVEVLFRLGLNEEANPLATSLKSQLDSPIKSNASKRGERLTELAWGYYFGSEYAAMKPLLLEAKQIYEATGTNDSQHAKDNEALLQELAK